MPWDEKHYQEIKNWVFSQLERGGINPDVYGGKQVFYRDIYIAMMPGLIRKERFEEAQAIKDAIMEWMNKNLPEGEKVSEERTLKIQEYQDMERINYHLSMGNRDDKYGLEPGYGINGAL